MNTIRSKIKKFLESIIRYFDPSYDFYGRSYSQEGEDVVLAALIGNKLNGFYVDIGAHHPFKFSNTYIFYQKGWTGINVDGTPNSIIPFNAYRPRDTNIETVVSDKSGLVDFSVYKEKALNGIATKKRLTRNENAGYKVFGHAKLNTVELSTILDRNMAPNRKIDFMNVDVEGHELEVLKSNNWSKYKPAYILVEIVYSTVEEISNDEVYKYLTNLNYILIAATGRSVFFKLND